MAILVSLRSVRPICDSRATCQICSGVFCLVFSFRACRASDRNHDFTLDTCQLTGQIINIQSAKIGFSEEWDANDNPPKCWRSTKKCRSLTQQDVVWKLCNGKGNCSFSQNILNYTLCTISQKEKKENFVSIDYNCINGK